MCPSSWKLYVDDFPFAVYFLQQISLADILPIRYLHWQISSVNIHSDQLGLTSPLPQLQSNWGSQVPIHLHFAYRRILGVRTKSSMCLDCICTSSSSSEREAVCDGKEKGDVTELWGIFFWLLGIWRDLILRGKHVRSKVDVSPWFQGGAVDEKAQFPKEEKIYQAGGN